MKLRIFFIILFTLFTFNLFFSGCKKDSDPVQPEKPAADTLNITDLKALDSDTLNVNNFKVVALSNGFIYNDISGFYRTSNGISALSGAGLWLGTNNGIPLVSLVYYIGWKRSNLTSLWDTTRAGLFHITPELTKHTPRQYLKDLGFPVNSSGKIKLYGDEMLWSSLHGYIENTDPVGSSPLTDVRVTQAVYGFKRDDLKNVLFIRYDIKNTESVDIPNIYAGYWSDTEVYPGLNNSTAFNRTSAVSYTYSPNKVRSADSSLLVGFTFAYTPVTNPMSYDGVTSHRILRKYDQTMLFSEAGLWPVQAIYALQGLDNKGNPMIDPITKEPTKFALTGDPYFRTGWLDIIADTRNFISSGPFDLKAQETKTIVVVWISEGDDTFPNCLMKMNSKIQYIRSDKSLWQ